MSALVFPEVVLFDLDGTLLDSAPDMLATVNHMRAARGHGPMALEALRPPLAAWPQPPAPALPAPSAAQ